MPVYRANDKYRATLRSTWIASPADSTLAVTSIPTNLPTIVTVGWNTQYETVFYVTSTSGTNSSNYALTGVTRLKGANANIPEGTALNCLNHEEFFNQYETLISSLEADVTGMQALVDTIPTGPVGQTQTQTLTNKTIVKRVVSTGSSGTITPNADTTDIFVLTNLSTTGAFQAPSGTPVDGQFLKVRLYSGTAQALSFATGAGGYVEHGIELPTSTPTGKYVHIGFEYVTSNSLNKWAGIALSEEE